MRVNSIFSNKTRKMIKYANKNLASIIDVKKVKNYKSKDGKNLLAIGFDTFGNKKASFAYLADGTEIAKYYNTSSEKGIVKREIITSIKKGKDLLKKTFTKVSKDGALGKITRENFLNGEKV